MRRAVVLLLVAAAPALAVTPAVGEDGSLPAVDRFNYVVGTQTIGAAYQFTDKPRLVETAERIREMGSSMIKFGLGPEYARSWRNVPKPAPGIDSLAALARDEPAHRRVLDMPFGHYVLWAHAFGNGAKSWTDGFSAAESEREYRELHALTRHLLTTYAGSGKTFHLGHWEGDGILRHSVAPENDRRVTPEAVRGMIEWLTVRQRAVDDAKRDTPHHDVTVWHYTEVNHVRLAMDGGRPAVVNRVLPEVDVDYVSYSCYDTQSDPMTLARALDFIEARMKPRPAVTGKRVFIGEYGFPAIRHSPAEQDAKSRVVMVAALEWGCPFVLSWELYNNEVDATGRQMGFWLIDDEGAEQPIGRTHHEFLRRGRARVADIISRTGTAPSPGDYAAEAVQWLRRDGEELETQAVKAAETRGR